MISEEGLSPDDLLDNRAVSFFYGLTRQALYDARKRRRLKKAKLTAAEKKRYRGRSILYRVRDLRAYRDSIDPRARHISPMHRKKP